MTGDFVPDIDIDASQWAIVHDILRRHVPEFDVFAFGSRAKRTAKPYSDLDIVVISHTVLPLSLMSALAEAFSLSDLPWKVDIVDWATTSDTFRTIIKRDQVLLQKGLS
jgi:predicted nucleotidyltransferase